MSNWSWTINLDVKNIHQILSSVCLKNIKEHSNNQILIGPIKFVLINLLLSVSKKKIMHVEKLFSTGYISLLIFLFYS